MADIIGFKIEYMGAAEMLDISQRIEKSINEAAGQLERFNRANKELKDSTAKLKGLDKVMESLTKQLRTMSEEQHKGSKSTKEQLSQYEKLIKQYKQAESEASGLSTRIRLLNKIVKEGPQGGAKNYEELVSTLARLKAEQKEVTDEVRRQQRAFQNAKFAEGSYPRLTAELGEARKAFRELSAAQREAGQGKELLQNIQRLDRELKKIDASMGIHTRNVGNYKSALTSLNSTLGVLSTLSVAGFGARELVEANSQVSDSIADVRKTTGLTKQTLEGYEDAVASLADRLETLDTRTSLNDLLQISAGAGQLGIGSDLVNQINELRVARDNAAAAGDQDLADQLGLAVADKIKEVEDSLFSFTKAVDTIGVALGDELPGDAREITVELTKLSEVFGVSAELGEGLDTSILRVGSTINTLATSTRASSASVLDFSKRLAGTAAQAGISMPDIAGIGATLDAAGISAEVSGTAISQFFAQIGKNAEQFAEVAGLPLDEFNQKLSEDAYGAFRLVLEGAQSSEGGLIGLADVLEKAGISSARAGAVINALTSNLGELDKNVAIANDAFEKGTSVVDEFNVKNQTLAAEIEKLKNQLINLVVDSGFQDFLSSGIQGLSRFIGAIVELPKFISENRTSLMLLVGALVAFNAQTLIATANTLRKLAVDRLVPAITNAATVAQKGLNAAMKANPIGIVIGLIAGLVGGLKFLYDNFESVRGAVDRAVDTLLNFRSENAFVNAAINALIWPLKLVAVFIKDGSNAFAGFGAVISEIIRVSKARLESFVIGIEIFFKQVESAITFSASGQRAVDQELAQLRARKAEYEAVGTDIGEAYQNAVEKSRRAAAENAAQESPAPAPGPTATAVTLDTTNDIAADDPAATEAEESPRVKAYRSEIEKINEVMVRGFNTILTNEAEFNAKRLEGVTATADETIKQYEREAEMKDAIQEAQVETLEHFMKSGRAILSQDAANRREYAVLIKSLALGEIAINLVREIQAINASNSVYPEPGASIIKGAAVGRAILTAAVSANRVRQQELEEGGNIGPSDSAITITGPGNVPTHGVITGPSHDSGGVQGYTDAGMAFEVEGGEYGIRNGPMYHVINKRSARHFRSNLDAMRSDPRVYSPAKHIAASQFNSYRGWGRAFAAEGASIPVLNTAAIPAPVDPRQNAQAVANQPFDGIAQFAELLSSLDKKTDAINARIDRLTVIADPDQIISSAIKGDEQRPAST